MFRALLLFPGDTTRTTMDPPLSVTLLASPNDQNNFKPVELAIHRDAVFTTAVGHSSKRTLAVWHVTTPEEVVEHMLHLVDSVEKTVAVAAATTPGSGEKEEKEKEEKDKSHL